MKLAQYARRGPVPQDVIGVVERDTPRPSAGEVLVEVLAAPINPSDVLTLTGGYGILPDLPAVGGNEGVGRVAALGDGVEAPAIGQTVLLPPGCGSWTTHVVAKPAALVSLPADADPVQLSMITVNPPTAYLLLREFADLRPGDWVLQNAANSAVGGYLVQLARARGLKTVNVVRREGARAVVEAAGGDVVLVDGEGLAERVATATGGARIRLGVDAVGGAATDRLAMSLAPGATLVNYGAMAGEPCHVSAAALIFRGVSVHGFWRARWFREAEAAGLEGLYGELAAGIRAGTLSARVQATYGLDDIRDAVAAAAAEGREGKIVLLPNGRP